MDSFAKLFEDPSSRVTGHNPVNVINVNKTKYYV